MEIHTNHEPENERFIIRTDDGDATLVYRHAGTKTLDFRSTFVPMEQRGRGIGERLVRDALDWARQNGYSVIPSCSFVRALVRRRAEYQDLVIQGA